MRGYTLLDFLKRFIKVLIEFLKKKLNEMLQRWAMQAVLVLGLILAAIVVLGIIAVWMMLNKG